MRKQAHSAHAITGVFVFMLLGLFAVLSTVMVLMGAKSYQNTASRLETHNAERIAPSYIRSMLRAQDETGQIYVEKIDGITSISMYAEYDGEGFVTRIYCYDGYLREWFSSDGSPFEPENGETVCPCYDLSAEVSDHGLMSVKLWSSADEFTDVDIALRASR